MTYFKHLPCNKYTKKLLNKLFRFKFFTDRQLRRSSGELGRGGDRNEHDEDELGRNKFRCAHRSREKLHQRPQQLVQSLQIIYMCI